MAYNSPRYFGRKYFTDAYFLQGVGSTPPIPPDLPVHRIQEGGGGNIMSTHSLRQYKDTGRKSEMPSNRRRNQQIVEFIVHFSESCLYQRGHPR